MTKQKCASNPSLDCSCGRTGVCNNTKSAEWPSNWPTYAVLDKDVLMKLRYVVQVQLEKTDEASEDELSYLNQLIKKSNDDK